MKTEPSSGDEAGDRPRVYLHVGAPKSGTSYLQNILWQNRETLRTDGVLYPGTSYSAQFYAAHDLQDWYFREHRNPAVPGSWDRLIDCVREWSARGEAHAAVISHENFSPARPEHVDRAMRDLAFAEVHIVYTARDLARQIPAAWQEDLKNRHAMDFHEYVGKLHAPRGERHPLAAGFWGMQDAIDVLKRWSRGLPPERVHVVTVPRASASGRLFWRRFAGLIGVDPDRYEPPGTGANASLGVAEAELLRRLNLALDDAVTWPAYATHVKFFLAQKVLAGRPEAEKVRLAPEDYAWTVTRSQELVKGLRDACYDVVGELDELVPEEPSPHGNATQPEDAPLDHQLDAAVDAVAALVARAQKRELEQELAARKAQPFKTFVRDASEHSHAVMRARVAWWHTLEALRRLHTRP